MSKQNITFRLAAYSLPAGKYNPDAPLNGNEDNFYVDDDLADDVLGRCRADEVINMGEYGCLLVVADGMGGMNAGEVASEIAISTVRDFFAPGKVDAKTAKSREGRKKYLESLIKEADRRIKNDAATNREHNGMGSTIILAWIVGSELTVSWCGDSRAYRFNPLNGIELISEDHSYVQELVKQGVIKYNDTFDHPQGNIVTRSLGDPNNAAKPETRQYDIANGDIILLCSDGLSGVLRDRKTYDATGRLCEGENIEDIVAANTDSMAKCREELMNAAERADWYDNVTVLLCQILDGAPEPVKHAVCINPGEPEVSKTVDNRGLKQKKMIYIGAAVVVVLIAVLCYIFFALGKKSGSAADELKTDSISAVTDTLKTQITEGQLVDNKADEVKDSKDVDKKDASKDKKDAKDKNKKDKVTDSTVKDAATGDAPDAAVPSANGGQETQELTPAGWREELTRTIESIKSSELAGLKRQALNYINRSDDEQNCTAIVKQLVDRENYLKDLNKYRNVKITQRGAAIANQLYEEILQGRYNPVRWQQMLKAIDAEVIKDGEAI